MRAVRPSARSLAWLTCSASTETFWPFSSICRASRSACAFLAAMGSAVAGAAIRMGATSVNARAVSRRKRGRGTRRLVFGCIASAESSGGPPVGATAAPETTVPFMTDSWRIEHDSMGEVRVPADAKWAAQTQRAVENFPISGLHIERALIGALAAIKGAAAMVNARLKIIDKDIAQAIHDAAAEVAAGKWDDQFPIDVYQTGSGTSSNMNANEVLATLASERLGKPVHPNDHVNASQSSNDVFPSAIHLAATREIVNTLIPALEHLARTLHKKEREFKTVVKSGRTHLMDATPVTLGQEFGGYAAAVDFGVERLQAVLPRTGELPLGGTAVGTGINAPKTFAKGVIARLVEDMNLPLTEARNHFEAQ